MLEVKELTKIYKTPGGGRVAALDGVSLSFPERGMVFLLGKSGSGKSTLLNLCGGLDTPTEGEIIVKGRSSKSFSGGDFDSYRNTLVGFVFQEYNILNEFTVEDNIALALELQGRSKDRAEIARLLEQVDLTGYAKRKPNTLSGGQKQRIAIARALVKSPEIIMADEPTGALDSATGKQVLETLKELSRSKLVIVVSHDREFAEQYGDRIIELKDGKVLSDVSKTVDEYIAISDNVTVSGDVLCIKRGSQLSGDELEQIGRFLKETDSETLIARGESDVRSIKQVSRITEGGGREVFRTTDGGEGKGRQYSAEDSRFIRSRLPLRHAIRIGASGLGGKPFRLLLTIVLCVVAFVMFGVLSSMMFYDSEAALRQTLTDSDLNRIRLVKEYRVTSNVYEYGEFLYNNKYTDRGRFSEQELGAYREQFGEEVFGVVQTGGLAFGTQSRSAYWSNNVAQLAYLSSGHSLRQLIIHGSYPEGEDQICISSFTAESIVNCRIFDPDTGEIVSVGSPEATVGCVLVLGGVEYTVSGVFDSGEVDPRFDSLKEGVSTDYALAYELELELENGLHSTVFMSETALGRYVAAANSYNDALWEYNTRGIMVADLYDPATGTLSSFADSAYANGSYAPLSAYGGEIIAFGEADGLSDDETFISATMFLTYGGYAINDELSVAEAGSPRAETLGALSEDISALSSNGRWDHETETLTPFTSEQREQLLGKAISDFCAAGLELTINYRLFDASAGATMGQPSTLRVAGVYGVGGSEHIMCLLVTDRLYGSLWGTQAATVAYYDEKITEYTVGDEDIYSAVILPYDHSPEATDKLIAVYQREDFDERDSRVSLSCPVTNTFEAADSFVPEAYRIFLVVGIVLAVFAALLLSNFISVSITQKRREIGILRAVGARGGDVFKIFFSESFVIAGICIVVSAAGSAVACTMLNRELAEGIGASLLSFGPASLAVMTAIALVTAVLATLVPVWLAAKKKPVDSIKAV